MRKQVVISLNMHYTSKTGSIKKKRTKTIQSSYTNFHRKKKNYTTKESLPIRKIHIGKQKK